MTRKGESLITDDFLKLMQDLYLKPLPRFMVKASSTGAKLGLPSKSHIPLAGAGGAWAKPSTVKIGPGTLCGTAASVMSSTHHETPWWNVLVYSPTSKKAHLYESCCFASLCGIEGRWQPKSALPVPSRQCKTCVNVYQKRVLEGLYER